MVERFSNSVLVCLAGAILLASGLLGGVPSVMSRMPVNRGAIPRGWEETNGRWVCQTVTPQAIEDLLKTLQKGSEIPQRVKIYPPMAEVIW